MKTKSTPPTATRPIGVFDSGIGGLTVVKALQLSLAHENLIYFGDIARVPYGTKSEEAIKKFATQCVLFLLEQNVKAIIIACNTISAIAGDEVERLAHDIPVINIIKSGAYASTNLSNNSYKNIGIIATPATINSQAYIQAIKLINKQVQVYSQACPLFVPFIEEGYHDELALELIATEYLARLLQHPIDIIILGCTHYPIITPLLNKCLSQLDKHQVITLIDPAKQASHDLIIQLNQLNLLNSETNLAEYKFFVTDMPQNFKIIGERILGHKINEISLISLD